MKKEIFLRINRKDYNNELEEILEKKDFSKDVKNLLLSMLYKVEVSYEDYATVKRNVKNKSCFIQDILDKIKLCEHIVFIKPQSDESKELEEKNTSFIIDKNKKTIKVYPNEKSLLYAINAFDNYRIYLPEKYNYLRIAFPDLLNEGNDINNVEIIRDFNAWSWNATPEEISNVNSNLIYQLLQILMGVEKLEKWFHNKNAGDYLDILKKELEEDFDAKYVSILLDNIYKLSILLCVKKNKLEKKRLNDEREIIKKELEYLDNKEKYLTDLSRKKRKVNNEIKRIDKILNDKEKLEKEFAERNLKLSNENQIFSLSNLIKILEKERKRNLNMLQEINKKLEPKNYVEQKNKIEKDYDLIKEVDLASNNNEVLKSKVIDLQKSFMKCFEKMINNAEEKKEIINLIYIFRYYLWLPYDNKKHVKDVKELNRYFNDTKVQLISKMYELKAANIIVNDKKINTEILKYIFETKMISMENMVIELEMHNNNIQIKMMDVDVLEDTHLLVIKDIDNKKIKYNKKVKVVN